ncbi:MAG: TolC family protein [Bacteroidia bacterium]|nr:TolC family protein [Bacteroidia bacterium]NNF31717.1 TolC family protein [Flavobacteriaceae bacterium]NNJ81122.1 TolC family protein [Flavobacteriaceae bacterium]NNK55231.1 TolC family protein [Flavobacteriaceae bacterium]NNM10226.1 TolC family protein [Flavobacteriaceae bacterium]
MKTRFFIFLLLAFLSANGQTSDSLVLGFREYLGYVKKFHPVLKQANLTIDMAQAEVMKARGGFDPKVELDYNRKKFKGTEYYDLLNATFKIPTWYGIELKANFEENEGNFINPERTVPVDGLYSAGVSFSLGQGLLMNERMATLKKAKIFRDQTEADREILVNDILYQASLAYFEWFRAYNEVRIFDDILDNALQRFEGIKRSSEVGDMAAIDTVEAKISYQNRSLSLEQARIKYLKRSLELSNFLWLNNNIPLELQPDVIPSDTIEAEIDMTLNVTGTPLSAFTLETHPKLRSLNYKIDGLEIDRRLKGNKLLPVIDLNYNFISETPETVNSFNTAEYKGGLRLAVPLFLRKERGDYKLAKLKVADANFELSATQLTLQNKITALYNELESLETQNRLISEIVVNYEQLLTAEERKFSFGESSIFLVNTREQKLIESKLKQVSIQNTFLKTKARLFNTLVLPAENL